MKIQSPVHSESAMKTLSPQSHLNSQHPYVRQLRESPLVGTCRDQVLEWRTQTYLDSSGDGGDGGSPS